MSDTNDPPSSDTPADEHKAPGYRPSAALAYGWKKFAASPATLLIPMIVASVGTVVFAVLVEFVLFTTVLSQHDCTRSFGSAQLRSSCDPGIMTVDLYGSLGVALIFAVIQVLTAGFYRAAFKITDGQSASLRDLWAGFKMGRVVVASLLVALGEFVGFALCVVPGIAVMVLTQFTLLFVVDREMRAVEAIKASIQLVAGNAVQTSIFFVIAYAVVFAGVSLIGLGLLVAYPVVALGYTYTFRRLQNEPVSPA